jgi:hypothetical protein
MKPKGSSPYINSHAKAAGVSRLTSTINLGVHQELRNRMHSSNPTLFRSTIHSSLQKERQSLYSRKHSQTSFNTIQFSSPSIYKPQLSQPSIHYNSKPLSAFYFGDLESCYPTRSQPRNQSSHSRIFNKRGSFSRFSHEFIKFSGKQPFCALRET